MRPFSVSISRKSIWPVPHPAADLFRVSILWWQSNEEQEITCPSPKCTVQNSGVADVTITKEM